MGLGKSILNKSIAYISVTDRFLPNLDKQFKSFDQSGTLNQPTSAFQNSSYLAESYKLTRNLCNTLVADYFS